MARSFLRSSSACAAMATNSLPRWLISITDMPASRQLSSSHFAFSSTSAGIVAGPAPKLKMRAAGLMRCRGTFGAGSFAFGGFAVLRGFCVVRRAVAVRAVAVFAIVVVAVHDALQARELLALGQVDERHALGGAAHLADLLHARADEHAAVGD